MEASEEIEFKVTFGFYDNLLVFICGLALQKRMFCLKNGHFQRKKCVTIVDFGKRKASFFEIHVLFNI